MKKYSLFIYLYLVFFIILHIVTGTFVYIIDPLQYFRDLGKYECFQNSLNLRSRFKIPGAIKFKDYDAIILGSCISQNFSYDQIYKLLGTKALNLGAPSLNYVEQNYLTKFAISFNKVKTVYWLIEYGLINFEEEFNNIEGKFPHHLYNKSISINLIKDYLLSKFYFNKSLELYFLKFNKIKNYKSEDYMNTYNTWTLGTLKQIDQHFPRINLPDKHKEFILKHQSKLSKLPYDVEFYNLHETERIKKWKRFFKKYMILVVEENPHIQFKFIIAPYSILLYFNMFMFDKQYIKDYLLVQLWTREELSKLPNVEIFDFSPAREIIFNHNNYTSNWNDFLHYKPIVNDYIITCMANNKYLLNVANKETLSESAFSILQRMAEFTEEIKKQSKEHHSIK